MRVIAVLAVLVIAVLLNSSTNATSPTNHLTSPPDTPSAPVKTEKKVLIHGPTGNYTAILKEDRITILKDNVIFDQTVENILNWTWLFNGSYAAFGIYHTGQNCKTDERSDKHGFYIRCPVSVSFKIVAIKDPRTSVICRDHNNKQLEPVIEDKKNKTLVLYQVEAIGVECKATIPPVLKVLIRGPTGNYTAVIEGDEIRLNDTRQTVGNLSQLSWLFNGSYAAFGVYYTRQDCRLGQWPDRPQFYVQCPVGSSFKIVVIKDPKVNVACRDHKGARLEPVAGSNMVEIYMADALGVECSTAISATVLSSNIFLSILVGTSFATMALVFIAMSIFLKRTRRLQTGA
ncbi:MAG: hypothetical protein ACK4SY_06655 [Pyrobaculum sp.]